MYMALRGVTSIDRDNLVVFYCLGQLESGLLRRVFFCESGLVIKGMLHYDFFHISDWSHMTTTYGFGNPGPGLEQA